MDLSFTDDELVFRDEAKTFFRAAVAADIRKKLIAGRHPRKEEMVRWTRILADKGWAVPD